MAMAMGDVESGMAAAVAEPDDCGRFRMAFVVGVAMLSFSVLGVYLIGPDMLFDFVYEPKPHNTFLLVAGFVCLAVGVCFFILFGGLVQEWEIGHPEGRRLVDQLLA